MKFSVAFSALFLASTSAFSPGASVSRVSVEVCVCEIEKVTKNPIIYCVHRENGIHVSIDTWNSIQTHIQMNGGV